MTITLTHHVLSVCLCNYLAIPRVPQASLRSTSGSPIPPSAYPQVYRRTRFAHPRQTLSLPLAFCLHVVTGFALRSTRNPWQSLGKPQGPSASPVLSSSGCHSVWPGLNVRIRSATLRVTSGLLLSNAKGQRRVT